ncbi:MAG: general secretion pathway protein GspK [Desulfobacterales bacterium]
MTASHHIKNSRGMALLITLGIIATLTILAIELNRKGRDAVTSVTAARTRQTLTEMATSGIHAGMALLAEDKFNDPPSGLDSILEDWADPEIMEQLIAGMAFENGDLTVRIDDELGKIQVNALVQFPEGINANRLQADLWERFLRLIATAEEAYAEIEPSTIIDSTKDWLDSKDDDAITGLNGAESDYYRSLEPPYECKNGPIEDLEELVLIKGVSPELFYGLEGLFGIADYLTPTLGPLSDGTESYFQGKININTADLPILAALMPVGAEILAPEIFAYREELSDLEPIADLSNPTWYKHAPGCSDIDIDPNLITTFSDFFRIRSRAVMDQHSVGITAVVQRMKDEESGKIFCKVLNWKMN